MKNFKSLLAGGILSLVALSTATAQNCQAGFTYTVTNGTVQFTNTSVGFQGIPIYYWNFGNNSSSYATNPSTTYNNNGTYVVCLTVMDSNFVNTCTNTICDTIIISNSPCNGLAASVSTTNESVCGTCDGTASANVTGGTAPYNYAWSNSSSTQSLSGLCSGGLSVTVIDANGCAATSGGTVSCPPNTSCQAGFTYTVSNGTVQFTNTSTGSINTPFYYWNFGNNSYSSQVNPTQSFTNGVYVVCLSMVDSSMFNTCTSSICDTITISNSLCNGITANISTANESVCGACDGTAFASVNGGNAPYTYTWSNNATGDSLINLCSGSYSVLITDANGCVVNASGIISCTPNQNCMASFTYTVTGSTITITNTSTGLNTPASFGWTFGDNTTFSGAFPPPHTYTGNGMYLICLTLVDTSINCTSIACDSVFITSQPPCSSYFSLIQDSLNTLQWYAFPAVTGTAPFTYLWDFGDGNQSTQASPSHTYAQAGQYTLCLTITDANGCTTTYCDSSSVRTVVAMQFLQVMPFATGIQEHENLAGTISPNPADQFIDLTLEKENSGTIRITDMLGNTVLETSMQSRTSRIDISELPAGYYTITLRTAKSSFHKKVAVVRQ